MAIPAIPSNLYVQQGNRQVYLSWDISVGSASYSVLRSTDGVNFTTLASPVINNYLDTSVSAGTQYWYQVASVNGSGTSPYTTAQSIVPSPTAEMSLGQIRLAAQQRADMQNSQFVTVPEWNSYINQAMFELYDLLVTVYEDYFVATPIQLTTDGSSYLYPLPDGLITFTNAVSGASGYVAPPFFKLMGIDLGVNPSNNGWVTLSKFNFIDRNQNVYPNSNSSIYGVFNMQYRVIGSNIEIIPTPTSNQNLRIWYIPRLTQLLRDTDITSSGISGWIEYVIVRAAKFAMDKQQLDSSVLTQEILYLKQRIEETASNRDAGRPDTISNTRRVTFGGDGWGGWGNGGGYGYGGN